MASIPDTRDLLCLDLPLAEAIRKELPAQGQLEAWSADAKALADPRRLAIAIALHAGERACVCDLSWIVARDDKLVSHHVRQLRSAGLARSQRDGKMVMYELTDRGRVMLAAVAPSEATTSVALIGFGLDSGIEGLASVIIIWRFTGSRVFSHAAERRAQKLVAVQFFILAPYVGFEATKALVTSEVAEVSWVGIGLAIGSVIFMKMLGIAEQRLADQIGSAATAGEGRQNMLCAYLAGALLIGQLGNALVGGWWLDPIVGLQIAAVAVREGLEAWRGDGCCVSSPLDGARFAEADDSCRDQDGCGA